MEITIDILKKMADQGYITSSSLISECENNPELLKCINIYEYVSQVLPGSYFEENGAMVKQVDNKKLNDIVSDLTGTSVNDEPGNEEITADIIDEPGKENSNEPEQIPQIIETELTQETQLVGEILVEEKIKEEPSKKSVKKQ